MAPRKKILGQILRGTADANVSFRGLCSLLRDLGFDERTKGSHHIFTKEGIPEILNLQPKGAKAKAHQVRQVRNVEVVIYWSDEDEALIAEVPELPGCAVDGKTYEQALANVQVIIEE